MTNVEHMRVARRALIVTILAVLATACAGKRGNDQAGDDRAPSAAPAAASTPATPAGAPIAMTVYKTPTCGCCHKWVDSMKAAGFSVTAIDTADVTPIRTAHGVTPAHASCHTAIVNGYVVEGHVPAADIRRMLAERPKAIGLAAPGMPQSAPGMDMPGKEPYDVLLLDSAGKSTVYARH